MNQRNFFETPQLVRRICDEGFGGGSFNFSVDLFLFLEREFLFAVALVGTVDGDEALRINHEDPEQSASTVSGNSGGQVDGLDDLPPGAVGRAAHDDVDEGSAGLGGRWGPASEGTRNPDHPLALGVDDRLRLLGSGRSLCVESAGFLASRELQIKENKILKSCKKNSHLTSTYIKPRVSCKERVSENGNKNL